MKQLSDRFAVSRLFGKLANIGDDISDEIINDPSFFKKVTGGGKTEAEYKGKDMFSFNPFVKFVFSANTVPPTKDDTHAVDKRMKRIPFLATFTKDDPDFDPFIGQKLNNQLTMEYLVKLGIEGLKRIIQNKAFTKSDIAEREENDYSKQNNPIESFIAEKGEDYLFREPTPAIFKAFQVWCIECGFPSKNAISFGQAIRKKYNLDRECRRIENGKGVKEPAWFYVRKTS